ncbi:hypothetical protein N9954_09355, partial [Maribacter sp.]|nr:hypothetical protein [Maribacter sp.]
GILMEWYQRIRKTEKLSNLISYAWLLGGLGGAFAAFCGWWLGETGLYLEDDLFLHRWIGIAIVIISFVGWWLKKNPERHLRILHQGINIVVLALITFEGHLGGNLTHGADYLFEYAPESVRNFMLDQKERMVDLSKADSVLVYADLVEPIFEQKCFACHNDEVQRGKLNMITIDSMLVGGDGGPAFLAGNLAESELFRRVTLPQKNKKFMPPVGDPLTYDEIKIVEWWIEQGASGDAKVSDIEVSESMKPTLLRHYGLDTSPRPYYEMVNIAPLDSLQITALEQNGFTVKVLGGENPLLDVKFSGTALTEEQLKSLEPAAAHITWLSLARTNVTDDWLAVISKFENLTRLQLEKTSISDKGVAALTGLKHLEALNIYGTKVTDACLPDLQRMEGLKRVYIWETAINTEMAKNMQENKEGLEVVFGG